MKDKGLIINKEPRDIKERAFEFAVRVLKLTEYLSRNPINNTLVNQIIRSATSIGGKHRRSSRGAYKKRFCSLYEYLKERSQRNFILVKNDKRIQCRYCKKIGSFVNGK